MSILQLDLFYINLRNKQFHALTSVLILLIFNDNQVFKKKFVIVITFLLKRIF